MWKPIFTCQQLVKKNHNFFVWARQPPYLSFWLLYSNIWFRIYGAFFLSFYLCIHSHAHSADTEYKLRSHRESVGWMAPTGLGHLDLELGPQPFRFTHCICHTHLGNRLLFAQITWAEVQISLPIYLGMLGAMLFFPRRQECSMSRAPPLSDIGVPGIQVGSQGKYTSFFFLNK